MGVSRSQLIFQRDGSMLVTPGHGQEQIAAAVRCCGELRKIVAGGYLYRLSPVAVWGGRARGIIARDLLSILEEHAASGIPAPFAARLAEISGRYGVLTLQRDGDDYRLVSSDPTILPVVDLGLDLDSSNGLIPAHMAGRVKLRAARAGWPVTDRTTTDSVHLDARLNNAVRLRRYQQDALEAFRRAGNGVVLLPCGAGKTIVGVAALCESSSTTLILGPSRSVSEQWRATILDSTSLMNDQVTIADAGSSMAAVTIATYHAASMGQIAGTLLDHPWGLVIYDEVQSLPADVFRLSAALNSARKLGLSATLVREDGRQQEVFALVGPPVYDVPWTELEEQGWIAPARCSEVRLPEADDDGQRLRYKQAVVSRLLARHCDQPVLIVGSNLGGLHATAERFGIPVLSGRSSRRRRNEMLQAFRSGEINRLAMSRIGSVGIDLPGAEVLIQISGTFGSRQEEAQRLGRLLRPAPGKVASFYTLVSSGTSEIRFAEKRQRFLVEQGYRYEVIDAAQLPRSAEPG